MEDVKWLEVAVNTTPERLDEVTAKLTAAGMASVVIEDEGDFCLLYTSPSPRDA